MIPLPAPHSGAQCGQGPTWWNSDANMRPTRRPSRVSKWLSTSSGLWRVGRPCPCTAHARGGGTAIRWQVSAPPACWQLVRTSEPLAGLAGKSLEPTKPSTPCTLHSRPQHEAFVQPDTSSLQAPHSPQAPKEAQRRGPQLTLMSLPSTMLLMRKDAVGPAGRCTSSSPFTYIGCATAHW
jgi:hypothetical protein